jgi:aerobic carbon-monoxide dehydrogenase large subunit
VTSTDKILGIEMATTRSVIGDAPKRREDARFLTGRGSYLDDLVFGGLAHAVVL